MLRWCYLLAIALTMASCGGKEEVATVSTEIEAIEILSLLNEFKIEAVKIEAGEQEKQWKVAVDARNVAQSNRILKDHGLPRPGKVGREAESGDSLFPSPDEVKQRHLRGLETEIERQLWLLPGVLRVKVIVSPGSGDILEFNPSPATASVVIVCQQKQPAFSIEHVRELVAGSVPKLKPENVNVAIATELPRAQLVRDPEGDRSGAHRMIIGVILILGLTLAGLITFNFARQQGWLRQRQSS